MDYVQGRKIDRVLIDREGTTIPLKEATDRKIEIKYIFIRDDGWTLASPGRLAGDAHKLWPNNWVHVGEIHPSDLLITLRPPPSPDDFKLEGSL